MVRERGDIPEQYKWNLASVYPSLDAWNNEYECLADGRGSLRCSSELQKYRGTLLDRPEQLAKLLTRVFSLENRLMKLYTYARLRHDEDVLHPQHKDAYDRVSALYHDYKNKTSWIRPEILQLDAQSFQNYLKAPVLEEYVVYLKKVYALKPHTLSIDKESLLSAAEKPFEAAQKAFHLLNDADLKFPDIQTGTGEKKSLSCSSYSLYMQSKDRILRKNAFVAFHKQYEQFENTICELINGHVQAHVFKAKARHYPSTMHAALFPHQIDVDVYHTLIDTIWENIGLLHRYIDLRKKFLGFDQLHYYDLHVSLVPDWEKKYLYEEAKAVVVESVGVMGSDYQKILEQGLGEWRWVDVWENRYKRSGAYSSHCYGTPPYILMNFCGTLRDLMTLSHEAGHSMHSYFSHKYQPYQYSNYPIFLAEIASIFHEDLLFFHLLDQAKSSREKCYLLSQKINDICSTLFRQTQFAKFELEIYNLAEENVPLNSTILKQIYRKLSADYYGPHIYPDPEINGEFLRIPHFYYNFYVYQYATGASAAAFLVDQVLGGGKMGKDAYMRILSSGSSQPPIELLSKAGVNMRSQKPIEALLTQFSSLLGDFESAMRSLSCA